MSILGGRVEVETITCLREGRGGRVPQAKGRPCNPRGRSLRCGDRGDSLRRALRRNLLGDEKLRKTEDNP